MIPLSVLELGGVREGSDRGTALREAADLAQHVESLGYHRFWVAEHHNMPMVTTAATAVVLGHVAAATSTIRVGAGGIMLPNHAPYVIAEQFGTLETLFPGRVDLGLGRAPGTDQLTLQALRRPAGNSDNFPGDVLELQRFLGPAQGRQHIEAIPGSGTEVPLWILGSSLFGAQLAAEFGLPYAFASHFAPQQLDAALSIYRSRFKPSKQLSEPYAMVGVNIVAADTNEHAKYLATSQQIMFANILRGRRGLFPRPVDDISEHLSPMECEGAATMLQCSFVGGKASLRRQLDTFVERTQADELIVATNVFGRDERFRSFELLRAAMTDT
ncbi:MAG: luciferase family oxidoreductase group 1 [Bradymonadia bacterium]|jgi:luciferase family oxidoreductase group 1